MLVDSRQNPVRAAMKRDLFAEYAVEWVFRMGNGPQCGRVAELAKRVRCNLARSVGLSTRDAVSQSFKPNDTLRILGQELKCSNGGQKVNPVEAGNGLV